MDRPAYILLLCLLANSGSSGLSEKVPPYSDSGVVAGIRFDWTTLEYFTEAKPFGDKRTGSQLAWRNNVFFAAFATKWLQGDRFTLNFTGAARGKDTDSFNTVEGWYERPIRLAP